MTGRSIEVTSIVSSFLHRMSLRGGRPPLVVSRFDTHGCQCSEQRIGGDGLRGGGVPITDRIARGRIGRTDCLRRRL